MKGKTLFAFLAMLVGVLALIAAGCGGGGDGGGGDAHEPGHSASGPGRLVEMKATDALRFEPSTVPAKAGEKVTFRVTNTGKAPHEFVIGNDEYHAEHAKEMASGSPSAHAGHDDGGSSTPLPPGATTEITFTMPDKAPRFACYVARHDQAGMTGTVTY